MINRIKKLFVKKIIHTYVIEFQPIKRPVDNKILFASEAIAREYFSLIYNEMVQYFLNQQQEKALVCQDILRDIKILSDIHGSKIDFTIVSKILSTNTNS